MRPLELRIRNFRSYAGEHVFDLRRRRLLAVVGPTGSGKSSLLDAIAFALYGRTPRIPQKTSELIHQRCNEATVELRFRLDGEEWAAVRQVRHQGTGHHHLVAPDGSRLTLKQDVDRALRERLGLDFDAFTRSVLLAQGRFAEFLEARPGERDEVLKGVFGHDRVDRMRERARARQREEAEAAAALERDLGRLDVVAEGLASDEAHLTEARARLGRLREAEPRVRALVETLEAALARLGTVERDLATVRGIELPDEEAVAEAEATLRRAEAEMTAAAEALAAEEEALAAVEADLAAHAGEEDVIARASSLVAHIESRREERARSEAALAEARTREEDAREALAAAEEALGAARGDLAQAERRRDEARSALAAAEEALAAAVRADAADGLRLHLHPGEPCPVCEQPVTEVPPVRHVDVGAARDRRERAHRALGDAEEAVVVAQGHYAVALAARDAAARALEEARAAEQRAEAVLADHQTALQGLRATASELLGPGEPAEVLAARKEAQRRRHERAAEARRGVDEARRALDAARSARQAVDAGLVDLRSRLHGAAAALGRALTGEADLEAQRRALAAARDEEERRLAGLLAEADADAAKARRELDALLTDLDAAEGYQVARRVAEQRERDLAAAVAEARRRLEEGERLRVEHGERTAAAETYGRLATELTDSRFVRHLLDTDRRTLAILAGRRFEDLSAGRYRFSDDGKFDVVDLAAAGRERPANSLSGGETFLASLALALGLAEMVQREGGRLDAFFLDEGFGSLDPEHLDLAMDGIEALVAEHPDRLVVVVSHVPALRERVEDLVILERDPVTGDTRVIEA